MVSFEYIFIAAVRDTNNKVKGGCFRSLVVYLAQKNRCRDNWERIEKVLTEVVRT